MTGKDTKQNGNKPAPQAKKSKPKRKPAKKSAGAAVNTAVRVKGGSTSGLREQGTDVLESVKLTTAKVGVVLQQVLTPQAMPRLAQLSKSFQRIRYHRLRFEIVTGCPSSTAGIYVAGFVKDARDPVNDKSASATLLASGGEAVKMWQSTDIVVNKLPDLYYTSSNPSEQRWSSPGSLVIAVVAAPTDNVTIQVFVHWDVSLSQPTYETTSSSSEDDGFATLLADAYSSTTNKYLSKRSGTAWAPLKGTDFSPPLANGSVVTMPGMRYAPTQNSTGTFDGLFGFWQLRVESNEVVYPIDDKGAHSTLNFDSETYACHKGERFSIEKPPNFSRALWYRSPHAASPSSARTCGGTSGLNSHPEGPIESLPTSRPSPQEHPWTSPNSSSDPSLSGTGRADSSPLYSALLKDILQGLQDSFRMGLSTGTTSALQANLTESPASLPVSSSGPPSEVTDGLVEDFGCELV